MIITYIFLFEPVIHGAIRLSSVMIDGETHRGKLLDREALERLDEIVLLKTEATFEEMAVT